MALPPEKEWLAALRGLVYLSLSVPCIDRSCSPSMQAPPAFEPALETGNAEYLQPRLQSFSTANITSRYCSILVL